MIRETRRTKECVRAPRTSYSVDVFHDAPANSAYDGVDTRAAESNTVTY